MNIRKIIRQELKKVISENYPAGAQYDSNAPWNQDDNIKSGYKASEIKYELIWTDATEFAFFKDAHGNTYVFRLDSIDKNEFTPYADREETYIGKDEDGMPDFEYGDLELDGETIKNYLNDKIGEIKVGKGLGAYESGEYELVMLDDALRADLMLVAKYIKNDKQRDGFIKTVSGKINESGVTDNIVDKKTMDTPTGTLFTIDLGTAGE